MAQSQDITAAPKGAALKIEQADAAYSKRIGSAAIQAGNEINRINAQYDREYERRLNDFEADLAALRAEYQQDITDIVRRRAEALEPHRAQLMGADAKAAAQRAMNGALTDLEG